MPVELLGGGELGEPVRDRSGLGRGERSPRGSVDAHHVQAATADVRHQRPVRRQARVDDRPGGRQLAHVRGADQVGDEQPGRQRERRHGSRVVDAERRDAGTALPHPLAPGPLCRGQLLGAAGEQVDRVGHLALDPGRYVEHPQGRGPLRPAVRAQEHHPRAVADDREAARCAGREAGRAGIAAREGLLARRARRAAAWR